MKRQLVVGDTIKAMGITATIASITFQEPWEWRNAWYLEFTDTNGVYRNWKQNCDGGKAYDKDDNEITDDTTNTQEDTNMAQATNNTNSKEDKNMNSKANGQAQVTQIEVDGVKYTTTRPNYYYKNENGKQTRISKAEWEQAFEQYVQNAADNAEQDEWEAEAEAEKKEREQKQAETDKQTEEAFNKKQAGEKKARKPRKSKDIAFTGTFTADGETRLVNITSRQVEFIKLLPTCNFYEEGLESTLWCDCIAMDINWNPMSVGAMISTLREKDLVTVGKDTSRKGHPKAMQFTALGKQVAMALGLE